MSLSTVGQSVFVLDAFARFSSDCRSFHTFPISYPHSASHLVRIRFRSQSEYTFVDQSRGQISSGFRYTRYGSAGRHCRLVHGRHGFYLGDFG